MPLPKFQEEQVIKKKKEKTESEHLKSLKTMKTDKYPGSDGLPKEFYENFRHEIKILFRTQYKNLF